MPSMDKNIEQVRLEELKKGTEDLTLPEDCEENDRAVRYLAAQTGIGHYDNMNLLVLAALLIFTAVFFLAVNSGDNTSADGVTLTAKTFISGEYTQALTKRYKEQLPIPEQMTSASYHIALAYGIGNTIPDRHHSSSNDNGLNEVEADPFGDRDDKDDDVSEKRFTVTSVITDENGETVTVVDVEEDDRSGGTTAVNRPPETESSSTTTTSATSSTTTNNDPPFVTTTTTFITEEPVTQTTTTTTSETTTSEEPVTTPTETETEAPVQTEPPADG